MRPLLITFLGIEALEQDVADDRAGVLDKHSPEQVGDDRVCAPLMIVPVLTILPVLVLNPMERASPPASMTPLLTIATVSVASANTRRNPAVDVPGIVNLGAAGAEGVFDAVFGEPEDGALIPELGSLDSKTMLVAPVIVPSALLLMKAFRPKKSTCTACPPRCGNVAMVYEPPVGARHADRVGGAGRRDQHAALDDPLLVGIREYETVGDQCSGWAFRLPPLGYRPGNE